MSVEPFFVDVPEACRLMGIGRSRLYEIAAAGKIESVSIGRSRRFTYESIRQWSEAQRQQQ